MMLPSGFYSIIKKKVIKRIIWLTVTINKSTAHYNTKLYTGNASSQAITGVGFQPDWCWLKREINRTIALFDAVRGVKKIIKMNTTNAEGTDTRFILTFDSDGFTLGGMENNNNGDNYASFN